MFLPRKLLNKYFSNSTLKKSLNSQFNLPIFTTKFTTTTSKDNPILSEIIKLVTKSPHSSVVPLLERYYGGRTDSENLPSLVRKLRRQKRFDCALEVSEWMMNTTLSDPKPGDLACHLSLIGEVHGLDAAEKFFKEADVHSEKMYGALLNCYVESKLVDKSLSHFGKMKSMGLAMSALPYNNVMTLYINTGQDEKVPELLSEMEANGISPDNFSYRMCIKSFALKSDFSSMEKVLQKMEQHGHMIDWLTYVAVANYYIEGGLKEKALHYLQQAELKVHSNSAGYNNLITNYAKIGGLTQIMNLWRKRGGSSKANINDDYKVIISSLVKLDQFQEAERFLKEWETCCSDYDFRVVNVLLLGYTQKGLVEKAEKLLEGILHGRRTPAPSTWCIICAGHIKCLNMHKATMCLKRALEVCSDAQYRRWIPNYEMISIILKWLGDDGEIGEVDKILKLLSNVVPMNEEMYQTLLRVNIRHGNEIDDILERMKADNIEVNEETKRIIVSAMLLRHFTLAKGLVSNSQTLRHGSTLRHFIFSQEW